MKNTYLSVVIPCYDEMANLQKGVLEKVDHFLSRKKFVYEIIVVDDGSTDGSVEFVERFTREHGTCKLYKNSHTGKAGAVTSGMLKAKGEYVLFTDMDQATPIEEVDKLLPYFEKGFDVVIGSRNTQRKGSPFLRNMMSKGWMFLRNWIVGTHGIVDTQCGFKIFRSDVSKRLFTMMNTIHHGFKKVSGSSVTAGFDVELLYIARKMGYKIKEVPVYWLYVETRRVNPLKESIEGLFELARIRINAMMGKYKKL